MKKNKGRIGKCNKCLKEDVEVEKVYKNNVESNLCRECLGKLQRKWTDWYSK